MKFILVIALFFIGAAARAASLDEWIDTALAKNPQLGAARQKWESMRQRVPQARAFEDPMIGVDVERDSTRFDDFHDNEWMLSQKLPWFGKRGAKGSVAELEAEVAGFQYLELMRSIRARVIGAHWDLWLAQQARKITAENTQLLEQFTAVAQSRYETGQGIQADLLRARVELAKMTNDVITMEREAELAQAAVNHLLAAEPNTPRAVATPPPLPALELSLEQMQQRARAYCCILMSFLRAWEAREAAVRVARLESAPDIEFRVEARQFNGRNGIQEYDTGISLNFPWLWRGKYRAMVNEAKADLEMAEADFDEEVNMTMLEIKELHTALDTARRLIDLYDKEVLPQAEQLVESTRAAYETGRATFLELIEAQKAWRDARLDADHARAQYGKTFAKLDAIAAPWGEREFATGLVTPDMK